MQKKSHKSAGWIALFDGGMDVRPALTEQQLPGIPAKRGVALLLSAEGEPVVLLPGANMRSRIRARLQRADEEKHGRMPDLSKVTARVLWKLTSGHFETDLHYLELAWSIWPGGYASLLAWKEAWFVHVDTKDRFGHFQRTRKVFASRGSYIGPLATARLADRFIGDLQDAFELCRNPSLGKLAPNAPTCTYGQMGKCLSPCDGRISLADYNRVVAKAADFAAGHRGPAVAELKKAMSDAAESLRFEQAAAVKSRLQKLDELSSSAFAHVASAEEFRFILVQRGASFRQAKVFLVDRGHVAEADPLDYPLGTDQARRTLERMADHVRAGRAWDDVCRWRMALVARYLDSSDRRKGLMLRWRAGMSVAELTEAVAAAAGLLGLRLPGRKAKKAADGDS
ncbi:MAG: UvrB/UvrC motif-containing protein [Phycisphaerae bacterium]|nr:UvrB/UvrC motif-containing protein [Phycisphaerae bacterium]